MYIYIHTNSFSTQYFFLLIFWISTHCRLQSNSWHSRGQKSRQTAQKLWSDLPSSGWHAVCAISPWCCAAVTYLKCRNDRVEFWSWCSQPPFQKPGQRNLQIKMTGIRISCYWVHVTSLYKTNPLLLVGGFWFWWNSQDDHGSLLHIQRSSHYQRKDLTAFVPRLTKTHTWELPCV